MIEIGVGFLLVAAIMLFMAILVGWILGNTSALVMNEKKSAFDDKAFLEALRAHRIKRNDDPPSYETPNKKKDFIETTGHSVIDFDEYRKMREGLGERTTGWKLVYSEELGRYMKVPRSADDDDRS